MFHNIKITHTCSTRTLIIYNFERLYVGQDVASSVSQTRDGAPVAMVLVMFVLGLCRCHYYYCCYYIYSQTGSHSYSNIHNCLNDHDHEYILYIEYSIQTVL